MASNDEGQGSGDCDDVYLAADEFLSLADETETGTETETGIKTDAQTETGAETSRAGIEPKAKRQRLPNKLTTTRLVVTEVWMTTILSQPRPRKRARATAIK